MITIRKSQDRGHIKFGWLDTYHTFSFGEYHDPQHMGFRSLRIINEDRVAPGQGFGMHPHRDMEIITYVVQGALQHKDSMGHGEVIRPGDVQHMTAGTGIRHSEFNPSATDSVHLLQIWIMPSENGLTPAYHQHHFSTDERMGRLRLVASEDGQDGAALIQQDARMYATILPAGQSITHELAPNRHGWVQLVRGQMSVNGQQLHAGDGAAISDETEIVMHADQDSEALYFDLA